MSCSSSSPSGTPMIWMLEHLKLSQMFLRLSSFFFKSCFSFFWLNVYFFLLLQIVDLSPSFLPFTVGSLYIFLYFALHSHHLFYFVSVLNHFCEHPWLPVFWTLHLIGWLSLHCLVLFLELWFVLSFGPYFFLRACYVVRGGTLGVHQGRATHVAVLWCCIWGSSPTGNNAACSALHHLSVTPPSTHNQIGPF